MTDITPGSCAPATPARRGAAVWVWTGRATALHCGGGGQAEVASGPGLSYLVAIERLPGRRAELERGVVARKGTLEWD